MRLRVKIGIFKKVPLCANFIIGFINFIIVTDLRSETKDSRF